MTQLSIPQIANVWIQAGGQLWATVDAVSIVMAESGGQTDRVSPSDDFGLWQINIVNFGSTPVNSFTWSNPIINAQAAIQLSGDGRNWAAWCTAWVDPGPNCGHGFIAHPQPGSPAADWTSVVSQQVAPVIANAPGQTKPVNQDPGTNEWDLLRDTLGPFAGRQYNRLGSIQNAYRKLW